MGVFAKVALMLSFMYYVGMRGKMKMYIEQAGYTNYYPKRTNFHEADSFCRPDNGEYTQPDFQNIY